MKTENTLSESMELTKDKTRYDAACKRLLSEKHILSWILHSCLDIYMDYEPREIAERFIEEPPDIAGTSIAPDLTNMPTQITGRSADFTSLYEGRTTFDLLFTSVYPVKKTARQILIDVETQNDFHPGYPLISRAVFYGGRMLSSQYGRDFSRSDYGRLKKVCSIWICLKPPKRLHNHILEYNLQPSFRIGKACRPSGNHDLFSVIMICLGDYNADECTGILRLLSILFLSDETVEKKKRMLEKEFHIPMTAELEKKVIEVGSFSDYIEQRGIEKGRKIGVREGRRQGKHQGRRQGKREGIREGRQEGIREGRQEGFNDSMLHSIKNVMESLNITVEQAMEILKVPTDRRKFFSQAVRKKQ